MTTDPGTAVMAALLDRDAQWRRYLENVYAPACVKATIDALTAAGYLTNGGHAALVARAAEAAADAVVAQLPPPPAVLDVNVISVPEQRIVMERDKAGRLVAATTEDPQR